MTNPKIDLPSKRAKTEQKKIERKYKEYQQNLESKYPPFSMTEIEGKYLSRKKEDKFWSKFFTYAGIAFIVLLFMTALYLIVGNIVDHQSQRALINKAQAAECMETVASYPMSTSSLIANLKELCG